MADLSKTIAPKSDQMNSDDLIGGSKTIKITKVSLCGEAEQPIAINYEGDNSKPYKPCKGMRRVLVQIWGGDGNQYIGRSLTLYRDEKVKFGGLDVGGIRISHMSHIDKDVTLVLTASKASRKPFTVKPLKEEPFDLEALVAVGRVEAAKGKEAFTAWYNHPTVKPHREKLKPYMEEFKKLSDNPVSSEPLPDATQAID